MTGRGNLGDLRFIRPAAQQQATLLRFIMEPQNMEKYKSLYKELHFPNFRRCPFGKRA